MHAHTLRRRDVHVATWVLAVVTFVAGDVVTTAVGLSVAGVVEAHPVSVGVLAIGGTTAMVAVKVVFVAAAFVAYLFPPRDFRVGTHEFEPRDYRVGIPLALAVFGAAIVGWNAVVVAHAAGIV